MAVEREKIYECEVKRRRVKDGGGYEPFWKVKSVAAALADSDTEFRCKDCFGEVKLLGRNSKVGAPPYVEHKLCGGLGVLRERDALQEGYGWTRGEALGASGRVDLLFVSSATSWMNCCSDAWSRSHA